MKLHAHTARTLTSLLFACALPCVCFKTTAAQTGARRTGARESKQSSSSPKQSTRARAVDARRRNEIREAVLALMETADDARSFDDLSDKADVQTFAADALWPFDEPAARSILRRAWDVTTAPGAVKAFRHDDEDDAAAFDNILSSRRAVIAVAAKHDTRLAEAYLKSLRQGLEHTQGSETDASGEGDSQSQREVWRMPSPQNVQRLQTARALLAEGAYEAAAAVAAPAVDEGVSRFLVDFIIALRARAPREGDALFLRLLERTRVDPQANANDVLLLSQPIVSPDLQVFINEDGSARLRLATDYDEAMRRAFNNAPAEVRRAFYATAATVLLRPPRPAENSETNGDAAAVYFTAGRLLPFFEREASQYAPALRARMNALASELGSARAQSLDANTGTLSLTPRNTSDPLASQLEELSKASDADARDRLRLRVVLSASRRELWERARTFASEIEDAQTQREARRVISIYQVMGVGRAFDDEPEGFERAAEFTRAADVPPEFRAAGLAQAAELAARAGRRERAELFVEEALVFANQSEKSGGRQLTALAFVARAAARSGSARTWDVLATLVAYANEVKDLSGVELRFPVTQGPTDEDEPAPYVPEEPFDLVNVFEDAARANFARTLKEARALKGGVERALITVAVAGVALEKRGVEKAR